MRPAKSGEPCGMAGEVATSACGAGRATRAAGALATFAADTLSTLEVRPDLPDGAGRAGAGARLAGGLGEGLDLEVGAFRAALPTDEVRFRAMWVA